MSSLRWTKHGRLGQNQQGIGCWVVIALLGLLLQAAEPLLQRQLSQWQAYRWLERDGARTEILSGGGLAVELRLRAGTLSTAVDQLSRLESTVYRLDLSNTPVADIHPLVRLQSLQALDLSYTAVADLTPLAALRQLQMLNLRHTAVRDITPLAALTAMRALDLGFTLVTELASMRTLEHLQVLSLRNIPAINIAPLTALRSLRSLDMGYMYVIDIQPLTGLRNLQLLNLTGTAVRDVIALNTLPQLLYLYLADTLAARTDQVEQLRRTRPQLTVRVTKE